jgi:hypothetical protein
MLGANQALRLFRAVDGDERDDWGRREVSYAAADAFVGNLHETGTRELTVDGTVTTVGQWTALVPPGVTVTHRDVIEDAAGRRFRVEAAAPRLDHLGRLRHTSCRCVLVGG